MGSIWRMGAHKGDILGALPAASVRHLKASGMHLKAILEASGSPSGGIWEASGGIWEAYGSPPGGIWEPFWRRLGGIHSLMCVYFHRDWYRFFHRKAISSCRWIVLS